MPVPEPTWSENLIRDFRAEARYLFILLRHFWGRITVFLVILFGGAFFLPLGYKDKTLLELPGAPDTYMEALHSVFYMVFFEPPTVPPDRFFGQALSMIVPFVGFILVVEGLARFGFLYFNRRQNMNEWNSAVASTYKRHIIIGGLGRIGYRIVKRLAHQKEKIVVIERNENSPFIEKVHDMKIPIIIADAATPDALEEANIKDARCLLAVTDQDMVNLEMGLNAREINTSIRVVLRMFNQYMAEKVARAFQFTVAFSTTDIAAPVFASAVYSDRIRHSFELDGITLNTADFSIPRQSPFIGKSIADIEGSYDLSIVAHKCPGVDGFHPHPGGILQAGDSIIALGTLAQIKSLDDLLSGQEVDRFPGSHDPPGAPVHSLLDEDTEVVVATKKKTAKKKAIKKKAVKTKAAKKKGPHKKGSST